MSNVCIALPYFVPSKLNNTHLYLYTIINRGRYRVFVLQRKLLVPSGFISLCFWTVVNFVVLCNELSPDLKTNCFFFFFLFVFYCSTKQVVSISLSLRITLYWEVRGKKTRKVKKKPPSHVWNINDRHRPCWIRNDVYVIYITVHSISIVSVGRRGVISLTLLSKWRFIGCIGVFGTCV